MPISKSECEGVRTWGQTQVQAEPRPYSYPFAPIERYKDEDITDSMNILDSLTYLNGFETVFEKWDRARVRHAIYTALACIRAEEHRRKGE